jgi:hypothetical protein
MIFNETTNMEILKCKNFTKISTPHFGTLKLVRLIPHAILEME